jgi:uncharacterized protein (UPF0276 family)
MPSAVIQQPVVALHSVPAAAGIGLRPPHHDQIIQQRPAVAWFEVHAENFMGHAPLRTDLEQIASEYPLSVHAVGLSLGSVDPPHSGHLAQLRELVRRIQPGLVSDHLSWSAVDGVHLPDLLPLPYTEEALEVVIRNVSRVQESLGRVILLENPSRYVDDLHSTLGEADFLAEVVERTGCGVLLDINNIHVSASNRRTDAAMELDRFLTVVPAGSIAEIHLAGHALIRLEKGQSLRLDDHGSCVAPETWRLYQRAIAVLGALPTLIEWDTRIPAFETLRQEAWTAQCLMEEYSPGGRRHGVAG